MVVIWATAVLVVLSTGGWAASVVRRDANAADQLWGVAQIAVAGTCLVLGEARTGRSWLCAALIAVWGARLTAYLVIRDRHRGEDWRHRRERERRRRFAWSSLPQIFWFQLVGGGLVVGLPMFAVVSDGQPALGWLDAAGVALWAAGLAIEALADVQLTRFRADGDNAGRVLDRGLWRYSRHPNYFGETVLWLGTALVGVASGAWWALFSPLLVLVVVLRVIGVAAMDDHLRATRGDEYLRYMRTTSAFVPLPRRSGNRSRSGAPSTVLGRP